MKKSEEEFNFLIEFELEKNILFNLKSFHKYKIKLIH